MGSFANLRLTNAPIGFVCVVYWRGANETFRQSFALVDEEGNTLDGIPAAERQTRVVKFRGMIYFAKH
jgi:hypothetical protein